MTEQAKSITAGVKDQLTLVREVATISTQLATARAALQEIANLALEKGADAADLLQEARHIADAALKDAGLAPQ